MAEVRHAREVLEGERRAVLRALRRNQAEVRKLAERRAALRGEGVDLLVRGRAAGLSMVEMADALGITRQAAHRLVSGKGGRDA